MAIYNTLPRVLKDNGFSSSYVAFQCLIENQHIVVKIHIFLPRKALSGKFLPTVLDYLL